MNKDERSLEEILLSLSKSLNEWGEEQAASGNILPPFVLESVIAMDNAASTIGGLRFENQPKFCPWCGKEADWRFNIGTLGSQRETFDLSCRVCGHGSDLIR